jgi:hypothetical protein
MAQRHALGRLRVYVEPAGSYAVDHAGTIGDFADLRFTQAELVPGVAVLPDESVVQRVHQRRLAQFGFKNVAVNFAAPLCSTGVAYDSAASPAKDSTSKVIEALIGGYAAAAGSAVASGASATGVSVTAAQGARFPAGYLAAIESGSGTGRIGSIVKIKTRSTDALVFASAAHGTPAVGAKVYNAQQLYPASILPSVATSLQMIREGEDRDLIWNAMGLQGALTLEWPIGGFATYGAQLAGAKWLHDDDIGTPQGGAALAVQTLDGSSPIPITDGSIVLSPISGTLRTLPTIMEMTITTGYTWQPVPSYNGVEGTAQMALVRGAQPVVSMLVLADDESWTDVREAKTKYRMVAQAGNVPGSTLGLEVGTMHLIAEPTMEERNGLTCWRLTWGVLEDEDCGTASTDQERAFLRIGRF